MTEERLLEYMASRKSWMSYEVLAKYFCVDRRTVQGVIKKLEKEDRVQFKFGENGKKLWHLKPRGDDGRTARTSAVGSFGGLSSGVASARLDAAERRSDLPTPLGRVQGVERTDATA